MRDRESKTGVIRWALTLPRRHQLAIGVSAAVALVIVGLDTVALAVVVPTVQFLTDTVGDAGDALGWLRPMFDAVGIPYTLVWTLTIALVATVARAAFMFIQGWLGTLYSARYEAGLKIGAYSAIMEADWPFFLRPRPVALDTIRGASPSGPTGSSSPRMDKT